MPIKKKDMEATVFNDAQLDLLNMMHWVKSPEALADLKQSISDYFAKKAKTMMDDMWANGEMTQEKWNSFESMSIDTPKNARSMSGNAR